MKIDNYLLWSRYVSSLEEHLTISKQILSAIEQNIAAGTNSKKVRGGEDPILIRQKLAVERLQTLYYRAVDRLEQLRDDLDKDDD